MSEAMRDFDHEPTVDETKGRVMGRAVETPIDTAAQQARSPAMNGGEPAQPAATQAALNAAAARMSLVLPDEQEFAEYRLIAKLGEGGMADVFLASADGPGGFNKLVVVKRLKPEVARDPEHRRMFRDEARLVARLNHPNVVQSLKVGEWGDANYLVMEFLDGQPLNKVFLRAPNAPRRIFLKIMIDVLSGLDYAHKLTDYDGRPLRVVHRDISPHNIFVTFDGVTKVLDFGIAKATTQSGATLTGVVKGKTSYMAPEQALACDVDQRADVFSVGIVLWELLTGRRFWGDLSDVQIMKQMTFGEMPHLVAAWPEAPPALTTICDKALAVVSDDRYGSAAEMLADLEAYARTEGQLATSAEVGRFLEDTFAEARSRVRSAIRGRAPVSEREVEATRERNAERSHNDRSGRPTAPESPVQGSVPPPSALSISGSFPAAPGLPSPLDHDSSRRRLIDDRETPASGPTGPTTLREAAGEATAPAVSSRVTVVERRPSLAPPRVSARNAAVASVAASLVTAVIVALIVRRPEPAVSLAAGSAAPVPAVTTPLMQLRVAATPPEAHVMIDDFDVPTNPITARFPRDGTGHRIKIYAEGYVPYAKLVVYSDDVNLQVTLQRAGDASGASTATPAASSTATPTQNATPTRGKPGGGHGKPVPVDTSNPWAK